MNAVPQLQTVAARRSMLARMVVSLVNKPTPLTTEERKKLAQIQEEMRSLEPEIYDEAERRYASAFRAYLRFGLDFAPGLQPGLSPEQRSILLEYQKARMESRDMGTGGQGAYPGATTGFFAPVLFADQVTSSMKYYGCMLDTSTIVDLDSGAPLSFPSDNDALITGEMVAENAQVAAADIPVSQVEMKSFLFSSKMVKLSMELARDSGFPLDVYLAERLAIRLGRVMNAKFTVGVGTTEPTGLMTVTAAGAAAVGSSGNTGGSETGATSIGTDDMVSLELSVDPAYRIGAAYVMHASTLGALKKVKNKQGQPVYVIGDPVVLNGYPVKVNNSMAQIPTSSGTNATVAFGLLKKYVIRRTPLLVKRLEQRFADYGQVSRPSARRWESDRRRWQLREVSHEHDVICGEVAKGAACPRAACKSLREGKEPMANNSLIANILDALLVGHPEMQETVEQLSRAEPDTPVGVFCSNCCLSIVAGDGQLKGIFTLDSAQAQCLEVSWAGPLRELGLIAEKGALSHEGRTSPIVVA